MFSEATLKILIGCQAPANRSEPNTDIFSRIKNDAKSKSRSNVDLDS